MSGEFPEKFIGNQIPSHMVHCLVIWVNDLIDQSYPVNLNISYAS